MAVRVSVLYSPAARVVHEVELELPDGATVAQAVQASGLWSAPQGAAGDPPLLGVWGRKADPDRRLRDHDRVEIYRPLTVDPKLARRVRFVKQGARASGLFARKRPGAKAGY